MTDGKRSVGKVSSYRFEAEPFHCDFTHRLSMAQLCNHLLNAADFHAMERGFGMASLNGEKETWVLSRLAVEMDEQPRQYEEFFVETWLEGVKRSFIDRNFRIADPAGRAYGYGRSTWALIETDTRTPIDTSSMSCGSLSEWIEAGKECPVERCSRVVVSKEATLLDTVRASYGDVDVNGHVNSIKYMERALDLFPMEWHATHRLKRVEMAYIAESHGGDELAFFCEAPEESERRVRIMRNPQGAGGGVEVCRCGFNFVNI